MPWSASVRDQEIAHLLTNTNSLRPQVKKLGKRIRKKTIVLANKPSRLHPTTKNPPSMDLVFNRTRKIPTRSWGQECSLCSSRHGVPIECSARGCKAAYHTTCAIRAKLKMQAIFGKNYKGGIKLRSYCKIHSPTVNIENGVSSQSDKIDANGVKEIDMTNLADDRLQEGSEELDYFWKYVDLNEVHKNISDAYTRSRMLKIDRSQNDKNNPVSSPKKDNKKCITKPECSSKKTNLQPKKTKLDDEIQPVESEEQPQEIDTLALDLIYRYWMLLRTANNGQSLIKFSPSALKEREFEQRKSILKLRIELERVRNLSYMIGKREKLKSSWLKTHQNIIKRTFCVINDLNPTIDHQATNESTSNDNTSNSQASFLHHGLISMNGKKSAHSIHHLQPTNGMFDESDQLLNDLITCDQIYDSPDSVTNNNHTNLSYQERSTLERRRTLSLVRRINRQLKSVSVEPSQNPYAKSYLIPKRSDSPVNVQPPPAARLLKYR